MKKVISLLMSFVMLLSVTAGVDLSAYAASNSSDKVYSKTIKNLINKYGEPHISENTVLGVCCVELIDFNKDGKNELVVAYNYDSEEVEDRYALNYKIYAVVNNKVKCVKKGLAGVSTGLDDRYGLFFINTKSGVIFETINNALDAFYYTTYSFNGSKFKKKDDYTHALNGDYYMYNDQNISKNTYNKALNQIYFKPAKYEKKGKVVIKRKNIKFIFVDSKYKQNKTLVVKRVKNNINRIVG